MPGEARGTVIEHSGSVCLGLRRTHATGPIDQCQLVGVDVELGQRSSRLGIRVGGFQQLTLGVHRDVFAGAHRQRSGQQPSQAGDEHRVVGHPAGADTQHEGEVADHAVVSTEHRGPEAARQTVPAACGQRTDDLFVDALIRRHRRGGIDVDVIRRAALSPLCEGKNKHRPEVPRQKSQEAGPRIRTAWLADLFAKQREPVLFVAALSGR